MVRAIADCPFVALSSRSENLVVPTARERLSQLLESLRSQDQAELRLVLKADTQGSVEAIRDSVSKIAREGGRVRIVHQAVGGINENDVTLADSSRRLAFMVCPPTSRTVRVAGKRKAAPRAAAVRSVTWTSLKSTR